MRRSTKVALIAGGATAALAGGVVVRGRRGGGGPEASVPDEDAIFTVFAPGGSQGFMFNGPIGWAFAKVQPISHAGVYDVVAEMLDPQPDDDLLDIGCGPGAFLATRAAHVRRVVGLDPSETMLHEAGKRLADRIADGTADLVLASSAVLPFADGEFSAVTAITAPANLAEVFRVLRPDGRFVYVDELNPDPRKPSHERTAGWPWNWTEADFRRLLEDAGFTDVAIRYKTVMFVADNRVACCRKPAPSTPDPSADPDGPGDPTGGAD